MAHQRHAINRLAGLAGVAALAVVLAACASTAPKPPSSPPSSPTVSSVSIDQGPSATMTTGATLQLTATVDASGGAATTVEWSSDATSVATVDASSGMVTAVGNGTAHITATSTADSSKSDSITVTVSNPAADPTNVYVDASAAAGGDGSQSTPYQTIAVGVANASAGGTVHVLAGTYAEALTFTKAVDLSGAGVGSTIITPPSSVSSSADAIAVSSVSGLTLAGFTLDVQTAPTTSALAVFGGSSNFTLQNVTISQPGGNANNGLELTGVSTATISNVTVDDRSTSSTGPGILVQGASDGITFDTVTVNGHENYAGIVLDATSSALSNITITNATLNQINKLEVNTGSGGSLTGLDAPQFTDAVLSANAYYGAGSERFYKISETDAIHDSLFNFGSVQAQSYIRQTNASDQSQLGDFVVGEATDNSVTLANSIQTAITAASAGDTIHVRSGTFSGALTVDKALTITGAGSTSLIEAPSGNAVITVTGDPVHITNVVVNGNDNGSAAVTFDASQVPGLVINNTDLTSTPAIADTAGAAAASPVNAQQNWWGQSSGPAAGQVTGAFASTDVDTSNPLGGPIP